MRRTLSRRFLISWHGLPPKMALIRAKNGRGRGRWTFYWRERRAVYAAPVNDVRAPGVERATGRNAGEARRCAGDGAEAFLPAGLAARH